MYKLSNLLFILLLLFLFSPFSMGQTPPNLSRSSDRLWLDSEIGHQGDCQWKMIKAGDATDPGEKIRYPIMQLQIGCRLSYPEQC